MEPHPILIAGNWRSSNAVSTFAAENPSTGAELPDRYPVSSWADIDAALNAAVEAAVLLRQTPPAKIAAFLSRFADLIEANAEKIVEMAHLETALPKSPRLANVELPRTTNQLRQASAAALEGSWAMPTIDTKLNIRSHLAAIGPVCVMGPNNFPLAFNAVSGGDFAAAIAAGNPVIAKSHPSHPGTTRLLAETAFAAMNELEMPRGMLQLIYHMSREDGLKLVADARIGATGFTGSRVAGLALKSAADAAGKPIYLEMSSLNPVIILPGALRERTDKVAEEFTTSCLAAGGQFCTKPGILLLLAGEESEQFLKNLVQRFAAAPPAPLLSRAVGKNLTNSVAKLVDAGAQVLVGAKSIEASGSRYQSTLLRVDGRQFLSDAETFQTEAFGNAAMAIVARDVDEAKKILAALDGQLTGGIYTDSHGSDDEIYLKLEPELRRRIGRLLNDKMPTGVAVTSAMNHGGPYPATGHPGFTAVGIPASMRRFSQLECYDNVRAARLPPDLQDLNPSGKMWRLIDGGWTQADAAGK
jgi:NADP-dependent aldehyde dehydrogenase